MRIGSFSRHVTWDTISLGQYLSNEMSDFMSDDVIADYVGGYFRNFWHTSAPFPEK